EDLKTLLACTSLASPKLSAVPAGTPKAKGWHVVRNAVVDDIYNHFVAEGSPWMVGLVGRSGSGKTTAAAMVVRHGMGVVRPLDGETHQQALGRLSRVRALFSDGVVWLRVGRDAAERLPSLMQSLALMVYENVLHSRGYPPGQSPTDPKNGTAYVQEAMHTGLNFQGLQCLLVADDVWEPEVVQELRKTGMRVLLTTRDPVLVDDAGGKAIMVERLRREEAEALVASAAELPEGARLPEPVNELFELCDYMPMYVESVARWTVVNKRSDGGSWSKAMTVIRRYLDKVQEEHFGNDDDVSADKDPSASKRVAILRAGFECLGAEDSQSRWLYLALAVMPGGHAFEVYEACVLLFGHEHSEHDLERTGQVVAALERWAIITALGPGLFRMHDARSEFARRTLVNIREDIRRETVERWQAYLSTLEVVRSVDAYGLLGLWQAVELVGGEELHTLRPYDSTLSALDSSDPLYFSSAAAVAELYNINRDFHGAEAVMRKLWERCEGNPEANPHASLTALWHCEVSVRCRDEVESRRLRGLMEPLMDVAKERLKSGGMDAATCESVQFLHMLGLCYRTLERVGEAELWFRRALKTAEEANLDADSAKIADARVGLAQCLSESGRLQEAEGLFRQSLQSTESRLGISAVYVTLILDELAWCLTRLDRVGEAEPLFRRSLAIKEARLGTEHVRVIYTLHDLARCLIRLERAGEAE
ncbi:unnamed protein product, partial [Sphacelaria rigidula]